MDNFANMTLHKIESNYNNLLFMFQSGVVNTIAKVLD